MPSLVGATVTGIPALLIILAIFVVFVLGVIYAIKLMARGARKAVGE